jgi:hypothetical protein
MEGVTTAIVAFIFLGLVLPSLIQNKSQYYVAFIAVIAIIFLDAVGHMGTDAGSFRVLCYVLAGVLQIIAIVMLFLATGGLTFRALRGDMIEVLRRGEEEKEVIIPLSEEAKRKIRENQEAAERKTKKDEEPKSYTIEDPTAAPKTPARPAPPASGSLPME